MQVQQSHPLEPFFQQAVRNSYEGRLGLGPEITGYVSRMLCEFSEPDSLFRLRDAKNRLINRLDEMVKASDPIHGTARSFIAERTIRKYIGDYTLFFTGMFPESINHLRLRRDRMESFVDWVKAGKESYYIVSKFDCFEYMKVAPLFQKLSSQFEQCVYGLNCVKNELQELQHPIMRRSNELLM